MSYIQELSQEQINEFPHGVNRFVAEAYGYLSIALVAMAVLALFSYHLLPQSLKWPLLIFDVLIWIACGWLGWRNPIKLVMPLFTVITGLLLGQLAHHYADVFVTASVMTIVGFFGLTAYVWVSKKDFSFLNGFLNTSFYVLFGAVIVSFIIDIPILTSLICAFGVMVFAGWILYDTSEILNDYEEGDSPAIAGFELIIDIVGLHAWLISLLDSIGFGDD